MISMASLVRAAHLAPSVGPFTIRRLMFRAGIFSADNFAPADVQRALPMIDAELREILSPQELEAARRELAALLTA
jgi:hypothetical protein